MDFRAMQKAVHENSVKHGFWNAPWPLLTGSAHAKDTIHAQVPTKLALIHSEVSEALECYRDGEMVEGYENVNVWEDCGGEQIPVIVDSKPVGLPSELADVVIRVMDLAEALGIDLEGAIESKHEYNLTRPYKHGGKAI